MPGNFADGLGYTVTGDALTSADCKGPWERVEEVWGGERNKAPQLFDGVFNVHHVEKQQADPSLLQRYQSRPGKTYKLARSVLKKLVANLRDNMPDPFESVYPVPPGSVIVSGVE